MYCGSLKNVMNNRMLKTQNENDCKRNDHIKWQLKFEYQERKIQQNN